MRNPHPHQHGHYIVLHPANYSADWGEIKWSVASSPSASRSLVPSIRIMRFQKRKCYSKVFHSGSDLTSQMRHVRVRTSFSPTIRRPARRHSSTTNAHCQERSSNAGESNSNVADSITSVFSQFKLFWILHYPALPGRIILGCSSVYVVCHCASKLSYFVLSLKLIDYIYVSSTLVLAVKQITNCFLNM